MPADVCLELNWSRKQMKNVKLSRRSCLKGLGASIALPWLEIMGMPNANAQASDPLRFMCMYVPNGIRMDRWTPSSIGTDFSMPDILASMERHRDQMNVISGLANYPASVTEERWAGSHARGTGALLTQTPLVSGSSNLVNGKSLDQIIADELRGQTTLASLELGAREGSSSGSCEDGFSCAYLHNLSWRDGDTPMKKIISPNQAFQRLFGSDTTGGSTETPVTNPISDGSILDIVKERIAELNRQLGASDQAKLDQYLTSIREVELNLPTEIVSSSGTCPLESAPSDASSYQDTVTQMIDLIALAFQCDKTRVITYMLEDSLNTPARYGFLGVNDSFHSISHHGGNSGNLDKIQTINTWEVEQFALLLDKLSAIQEGDGTVLDNSFLLFTSEFGDADDHYHWDLPMLTAGKAGGYLKAGQHISYDISSRGRPEPSLNDKPMANLFLNVLESFNINQSTFGTINSSDPYGTSTLSEIKA